MRRGSVGNRPLTARFGRLRSFRRGPLGSADCAALDADRSVRQTAQQWVRNCSFHHAAYAISD
ncbi:hypothetical protein [Paenibacillus sp. NEAU-GSW1]|uniref:hypothetical protein n=1 Tax=Paenibacillus sp. NEAU-GSW1 TaxID=2682486 RepID=UPI0012E16905|nr:hypothetical protein [Paenibacillus sp. NEAU-GSW1]MUT65589.1 hypothetical protein [Paenibacillus sp. NEAU-GSW1]